MDGTLFDLEVDERLDVLFRGDICYGNNYQARALAKGREDVLATRGYDAGFSRLTPLVEAADFVVANYEATITDLVRSPIEGKKKYLHWDHRQEAPQSLARQGIHAVSLGNNHAYDYGEEGLRQTLEALADVDIPAFGAGLDHNSASRPLKRRFGVAGGRFSLVVAAGKHKTFEYEYPYYAQSSEGGVNAWTKKSAVSQIEDLRRSEPDSFLVAFPHWGRNYSWKTRRQGDLGRSMIDAGADLVIGHGAHMLQEVEAYREKWIVYSLGNFVFNSRGRFRKYEEAVPYGLIARPPAPEARDWPLAASQEDKQPAIH